MNNDDFAESYFNRWNEYYKIEYYRKAAEQYVFAQIYWYEYKLCQLKIKKCVDKIINDLIKKWHEN